ncbi:hypothetical protein OBBRIDRAFT_796233 [Obba rivulosa]|uniref:Uncharacterized protein n=1 Tax=Obba rivulosa TaxID=1052685 RepID=A0A8E2AMI3_9APHY|nr:hypothetical protein OBBRIDRAFT_796233 [Obba rivulosa]
MSDKPTAIIFGGLNTCSRALAQFLVPLDGEPLVKNLRIVDKYSVNPPTTYLGAEFPQVLKKPNVEYRQANLTVPATVKSCFDPPAGQDPYTYVFDLSGEIQWDRPEKVQISTTFQVAQHIGREAAARGVAAYVRIQHPFYECRERSGKEKDWAEHDDAKPDGVLGTWWHESLRALAAIDGLNLVILRTAYVYGPYVDYGLIISWTITCAVYGYLKQPLKGLWSPGKHPTHTVHVTDVAGAMWACAKWMAERGRAKANEEAGEEILPALQGRDGQDVQGIVPAGTKVVAPLFNIEDDSKTTYLDLINTLVQFFGTTFEFHSFLTNTMAKFKLEDVVEEINEQHVSTWTQMLGASNPPVTQMHLSQRAYMDPYALRKHSVAFPADKIKALVGYALARPTFGRETIAEMVDKFKQEGSWPRVES